MSRTISILIAAFLLVAIVAMPGLWIAYYMNWQKQRQSQLEEYLSTSDAEWVFNNDDQLPLGLRLLDEAGLTELWLPNDSPPADVERARLLFPEVRITLLRGP